MDFDWLKTRIDQDSDLEATLRDAAAEISKGFNAERITIFRATEDGTHLVAIVQTGLESFGAVTVRIDSSKSVAGQVGALRRMANIGDVYDEKQLAQLHLKQKMFKAVDQRTGYQTHQVLAAPIVSAKGAKLLGVIELLNRTDKKPFPKQCEADIQALCALLAPAFSKARAHA